MRALQSTAGLHDLVVSSRWLIWTARLTEKRWLCGVVREGEPSTMMSTDQLGRQRGESIRLPIPVSPLYGQVLPLDVTEFVLPGEQLEQAIATIKAVIDARTCRRSPVLPENYIRNVPVAVEIG